MVDCGDLGLEGGGDWLFGGEHAEGVEAVDADVEHGAAASEFFGVTPLAELDVEAVGAFHGLKAAEFASAHEVERFEGDGFEVEAVGDHELDVRGFAGVDHLLTFGGADGHWFFAEDVLACLGGADGVLGVHAVGKGDVDGVDGGVGGDAVEVFVAVDGLAGDAVLGGDTLGFVAMAADEAGDSGVLGVFCAFEEVSGDAAEADDAIANFAVAVRGGGLRECAWCPLGG